MLNRGKEETELELEEDDDERIPPKLTNNINLLYQTADAHLIVYIKWTAIAFIFTGLFSGMYALIGKFSFSESIGSGEFVFYFFSSPFISAVGVYLQRKRELIAVHAYNNKKLTIVLRFLPVALIIFYVIFIFTFVECYACIGWSFLILACFSLLFLAYRVYQRLETNKKPGHFENIDNGKYQFSSKISEDSFAISKTINTTNLDLISVEKNFDQLLQQEINEKENKN